MPRPLQREGGRKRRYLRPISVGESTERHYLGNNPGFLKQADHTSPCLGSFSPSIYIIRRIGPGLSVSCAGYRLGETPKLVIRAIFVCHIPPLERLIHSPRGIVIALFTSDQSTKGGREGHVSLIHTCVVDPNTYQDGSSVI